MVLLMTSVIVSYFVSLHRLISAYRDKIERSHEMKPNSSEVNIEKDWYYKKYGKEIIKRYRKKYLEKFGFETLTEK